MAGAIIGKGAYAEPDEDKALKAATAEYMARFVESYRRHRPPLHAMVLSDADQTISAASSAFQSMLIWLNQEGGADLAASAYAMGAAMGYILAQTPVETPTAIAIAFVEGLGAGEKAAVK